MSSPIAAIRTFDSLMASGFLIFVFFLIGVLCDESRSMAPMGGAFGPIPATPHSPWISGPQQKKFQFHVGQQSWLAAREICLAENSDLLTVGTEEELEWIIGHYRPQLKEFSERQIQIGILAESDGNNGERVWKFVTGVTPNFTLLPWVDGEPFDHAEGRERCTLLNVFKRTLEDVDCDLNGNPSHFYRFVCERTHEGHIKHEELNNPLWKKLEDILVFFGISSSSSAPKNETELIPTEPETEDYWDKVHQNTTESTTIPNIAEDPTEKPKETKEEIKEQPKEEKPKEEEKKETKPEDGDLLESDGGASSDLLRAVKTLNDGPPPPVVAHGTKIGTDHLGELDKLERNEEIAETAESITETPQRTTKADPLAHLADTLEKTLSDSEQRPIGNRMHHLERIINAVQTMLEEPEKKTETNSTTEIETIQLVEKRHRDPHEPNPAESGDPKEHIEIALNFDSDFESAHIESIAADGLIVPPKAEEVIGCGAKNLGGTKPPTSTTPLPNREQRIDDFLASLRKALRNSSSDTLSELLHSDSQSIEQKLQKLGEKISNSSVHSEKVDSEIMKSLEELGKTESREFVEMESNSRELSAIGSGLEPPPERLITLTPVALKPHSLEKGFDNSLMLKLPSNETKTSTLPESEEEEPTRGSGETEGWLKAPNSHETKKAIEKILNNPKKQTEAKKAIAAEKRRVDKAYDQFNAQFNQQSLLERIRKSEEERSKNGGLIGNGDERHSAQITLEQMFNDWAGLVGR